MNRRHLIAGAASAVLLTAAGPRDAAPIGQQPLAPSVARELERIAGANALWPGFDPLAIPLAVYTGSDTWLFRHPRPPEGFSEVAGARPRAYRMPGRHPAVTSNTSADINGTMTATLLADGPRASAGPTDLAAAAMHEAFHVFQRARHPRWSGNEGELLFYPIDDAALLALRRLESLALARALAAPGASSACWAREAMRLRRERFAGLGPAFATYERLTELNEGLATWVQLVAAGRATVEIPPSEFKPGEVRDRVYAVGPALAFLLDRFDREWRSRLEAADTLSLDGMLAEAVAARAAPARACGMSGRDVEAANAAAARDAAAVAAERAERERRFAARPGWRVVVQIAGTAPLWPQGFDPLNMERLASGVLHTRFLKLGNEGGEIEMVDEGGVRHEALTERFGEHPLFNGVRRVTVAGLAKPAVEIAGTRVTIRAPGLRAEFRNATARPGDSTLVVDVSP